MLTLTHTLDGSACSIHYPEHEADLDGFRAFLARGDEVLALDTETSDLDVYRPAHKLRLVQLGNDREAWVLDAARFAPAIREALAAERLFVCHNAAFDLLVLDRHGFSSLEELGPRTLDTRIMAHLLDPRSKHEGGAGLRLKELAELYVDPHGADGERELVKLFRKLGETKETGWAVIPIDHPDFVRYAGLDVLLTSRVYERLSGDVSALGMDSLAGFEHRIQYLLAILQRRGMRLDVAYTEQLREELVAEAERFAAEALLDGVPNVNSTRQVAAALLELGEKLTERTPSGDLKVDRAVLLALADLDAQWQRIGAREPNPLADAVIRSKRAAKWATAYAEAFLTLRDGNDRLHPFIGGLSARTARMSVSRPPLQQLPSSDWRIRRAFIADPGQLIIAADYSQVEMRVLAALCQDATMVEAIKSGTDLHDFTASRVFGPDFTKAQRKVAKAIGFGKVYGGGLTTIVRQTGAAAPDVKRALEAYDRTFPGVRRFSRGLQRKAEYGAREVTTPIGRRLPLDRDRLYAGTNYVVQSTSRDVLAMALVRLFDAGLGDHLLLPVHDELVAQAPAAQAAEVVDAIRREMTTDFYGLSLEADAEVYGPSWGSGYGCPAELDYYPSSTKEHAA